MKTVRLSNNIVCETIPAYAIPVEQWYGADFAARCVEAPDEVAQGWVYDPETGSFAAPDPDPEPAPTPTEQLRADVDYIAVMTGVSL